MNETPSYEYFARELEGNPPLLIANNMTEISKRDMKNKEITVNIINRKILLII